MSANDPFRDVRDETRRQVATGGDDQEDDDDGLTRDEERNVREGIGAAPDDDDDDDGGDDARDDTDDATEDLREARDETRRDVATGGREARTPDERLQEAADRTRREVATGDDEADMETRAAMDESRMRDVPDARVAATTDLGSDRELSASERQELIAQADLSEVDRDALAIGIRGDQAVLFAGQQADQRAEFETETTLRQRFAGSLEGVEPDDVEVSETETGFTATLTERARREIAIERVAERRSDLDEDDLVARLDDGDVVVELAPDEIEAREGRAAARERLFRQAFDDVEAAGIETTRPAGETNPANALLDQSEFNQAVAEAASETEGVEIEQLAENPIQFLRGAGQERQERFINQLTGGLQERLSEREREFRADVTPGEDVVTQQDVAREIRGQIQERETEVATLAAAGVAAPEPVTTAAGGAVLGGLAVAAAVESGELDVPATRERTPGEIEAPSEGTERPAEIEVPTDAFESERVGEIPVDRTPDETGEIAIPDEPQGTEADRTIRTAELFGPRQRQPDERDAEEMDDMGTGGEFDDADRVRVPEEMIPEETVVIGEVDAPAEGTEQTERTEVSELDEEGMGEPGEGEMSDDAMERSPDDVEIIERDRGPAVIDEQGPGDVEIVDEAPQRRAQAESVVGGAFARIEAASESLIGSSGQDPLTGILSTAQEVEAPTLDTSAAGALRDTATEAPSIDTETATRPIEDVDADLDIGTDVATGPRVDQRTQLDLDVAQLNRLDRMAQMPAVESPQFRTPGETVNLNLDETVNALALGGGTTRGPRRPRVRLDQEVDVASAEVDTGVFDTEATAPIAGADDIGDVELDLGDL